MSRVNNKEYDHNYYIKHKRPKSKIGQAELKIADLEAKLSEKEKELAYMTKQAKKFNNEAQKYYEDAYCNSFQNQKAIAELEKVKEQLDKEIIIMSNFDEMKKQLKYIVEISVYIQQRLKELKGEKNDNR